MGESRECDYERCDCRRRGGRFRGNHAGGGGAIYGIGIFGALYYYLGHAATFGAGLIGIVKAIFWPAVVVAKALALLYR